MAEQLGTVYGRIDLDVRQAMQSYTQLRQQHLSTLSALSQSANTLSSIGNGFLLMGTAIAGAFVGAGVAYGEFERKLDYFGAVSDATKGEMSQLTDMVLDLGARTIYTNDQIADGFVELAKAGVSAEAILGGIGEGVTHLGAAADIGLDKAATMMMSVVATWKMAETEASSVADTLAGTANASMVEIEDLGVSMKYAGGVAASLGIEFEDLSTALGILGQRSIKGSTAGTSLRQIMIGLTGNTNKATKEMERLGIITADGTNQFFNADGSVKSLSGAMEILGKATEGMGEEQRIASLKTMFNVRAMPSLLALLDSGTEGFDKMAEAIQGVSAADVASARLDNLSGDIEYLRGELDNLILSFGALTQGTLRSLVQGLESAVAWFNGLSEGNKQLVINIGLAVAGISLFLGVLFKVSAAATHFVSNILLIRTSLMQLGGVATVVKGIMARLFTPPVVILLIAAAIAALVGSLIWFFTKTETGQKVWENLSNAVMPVITAIGSALGNLAQQVGPTLETLGKTMGEAFGALVEAVIPILVIIGQAFADFVTAVTPMISPILEIFGSVFSGLVSIVIPILQSIVDAFKPVGDAAAPLGGQLSESASQIATAFAPVAETFMNDLLPALLELGRVLVELGLQIGASLGQALMTLIPIVLDVAASILPLVMALASQLMPIILNLVQTALPIFVALLTTLATIFGAVITAVMPLVSVLIGALAPIITMLVGTVLPILIDLITTVATVFLSLVQAIMPVVTAIIDILIPVIEQLLEIVTVVFEAIVPIIEGALNIVKGIIQTVTALIKGDWEGVWNGILAILSGIWDVIKGVVQGAIAIVSAVITGTLNVISGIWSSIWGAISSFLSGVWSGITNAVKTGIDGIVTFFTDLPGNILSALGDFGSMLLGVGQDLVQGLANGISGAADAVMNAIGNVVNGAIDWAKGLLGIKSPSRVFRSIGDYLGQGFIQGINSNKNGVKKATEGLVKQATDVYRKLSDNIAKENKTLATLNERYAKAQRKLQELTTRPAPKSASGKRSLANQIAEQKRANASLAKQVAEQKKTVAALKKAQKLEKAVKDRINADNKKLMALTTQRDKITEKLKDAQKNLKEAIKEQQEAIKDYRDSVNERGTVTQFKTTDGMTYNLERQIEQTKKFNRIYDELKKKGLDKKSLEDLANEFATSGSITAAEALNNSTAAELKQLAGLRKKLDAESSKIANKVGKDFHQAGVDAARGIVKGLESQLATINKSATTLAQALVKAVKKALGIKSPSRVFAELGDQTMAGMLVGLARSEDAVKKQLDSMASDLTSFYDQVFAAKQFELETTMTLRASDQASLNASMSSDRSRVDQQNLMTKLDSLLLAFKGNESRDTYHFGDIMIKDLESIKTLEEFMNMIQVYKRQQGVS